tara:strand:+ start:1097 stop:1528 length:432 start_codon:yes stop_codon:yes gene_type:complete
MTKKKGGNEMNLTKEEMRMNKEKHTHHMLNGVEYTGELNEWGYPVGLVFNGCRTEKKVVRTELEAQEGDNLPRYEETLHIHHINHWKPNRESPKPRPVVVAKRTVASLKDECRALGLKVGGKKAELEARLANFYASIPTGEEE